MVSVNPMYKRARARARSSNDSGATALVALESLYGEVAAGVVGDTACPGGRHDVPARLRSTRRRRRDPAARRRRARPPRGHPRPARARPRARRRDARAGRPRPRRRRLPHLHLGHDRPAEGRDEHARQRRVQRAGLPRLDAPRTRTTASSAPRRCSTSPASSATSRVAMLVPMPLVLFYRFEPGAALELAERARPTFTIAAITAFIALLNHPDADEPRPLVARRRSTAAARRSRRRPSRRSRSASGAYIHNIYGLTETTSPSHAVPLDRRAPVDESSGALSVGVPGVQHGRAHRRRGRRGAAARRGRRVRHERPAGRARLLGEARGDRARAARRRAADRRRRLHGRPTAGSTSSTARRTRSTPRATRSGRARSRTSSTGTRRCARPRSSACRTSTAARPSRRSSASRTARSAERRRAHRVLQGADGRLQVPAAGRDPRRDPEDRDRQDPAARAARLTPERHRPPGGGGRPGPGWEPSVG